MIISLMNDLMKNMMIFDEMNEGHLPHNMNCGFEMMLMTLMKCFSRNVMLTTVMKCFSKNVMLMTVMKSYGGSCPRKICP